VARKYARDNHGRFASTGTGATARGGRLKTASGNTRATQTIQAGSRAGVVGKPAGLAPGSIKPRSSIGSVGARLAARDRAVGRGDGAAVNISLGGSRGKRLDSEISRNVKAQQVASRAADKTRNKQFKSEQSRAKKLREVHVAGIAKAKGISPAQVESALKAQPPSVQIKAVKNWVKENRPSRR
jgi:hypothetical protein